MALLRVEHLCHAFGGVTALDDVSFAVEDGEAVALIGPNGAGKSTCFGVIAGQTRPDGGRVLLGGADVTGIGSRRMHARGVGRGFQVPRLFSSMTARENVQTALLAARGRVWRFGAPARRHYVTEANALLGRFGLRDRADRPAGTLAYGDVKRLELAMVLAGAPRLLLLDEPTAGMARPERLGFMDVMRRVMADQGIAILFVEHDMEAVFGLASRVLVMDRGVLIAEGTPAAIRADPRVREVYLGP